MRETIVLRSFLAFSVKVGTLEGPKLTEMVVQKHFTLYQTFILPKSWKFGLLGPQNWIFGTIFQDRSDVPRLFLASLTNVGTLKGPKIAEMVL